MVATKHPGQVVALDVGHKRIGVARTVPGVRIAQPLTTLSADESLESLHDLLRRENCTTLVVGLPRGLDGQSTAQTAYVQQFVSGLRAVIEVPVVWQDEALTSVKAEDELRSRGKPYAREEVDALAATFILEDYLRDQPVTPQSQGSDHV